MDPVGAVGSFPEIDRAFARGHEFCPKVVWVSLSAAVSKRGREGDLPLLLQLIFIIVDQR